MDLKEIRQIVALMNDHGLSLFHLEKKDFNIKLKKGTDLESLKEVMKLVPAAPAAVPAAAAPVAPAPAAAAPAAPEADAGGGAEGDPINSPMVGTFYGRPSPESDPYVEVGTKVSEGQILCIIEAMKVMNEIKAERSGEICEICVEDSTPVQYGDDLFRIK